MNKNKKMSAGVKSSVVKDFEQKMIQNSAANLQAELIFDIEVVSKWAF